MRVHFCRAVLMATGMLGLLAGTAQTQPLTKTELIQRGKATVALVEGPGLPVMAATCLHPTGLFITDNHSQLNPKLGVTLILNSNTAKQKSFKAKVVCNDPGD